MATHCIRSLPTLCFVAFMLLTQGPVGGLKGQGLVKLSGVLVAEDGPPVGNAELSVLIRSSQDRRRRTLKASTDAKGRFEVELKSESSGVLHFTPYVPGRFLGWQGSPPCARADYPLLEFGKDYDLGRIAWKPWPIAFAGRVVGPNERPVPQAKVRLRAWRGEGPGHYVTELSNEQGRFVFRGQPARALQWAISAQAEGARSREALVRPSQEDREALRIQIASPGGLAGQVRTHEPELPVAIEVRAESTWNPPGRDHHWRTIAIESATNPEGRFELDGLLPGLWDVQILLDGEEVTRIRDLRVDPGAIARPKTLQELTVAKNWATRRVIVQNESGNALKDALVAFVPAGIAGWRLRPTNASGVATAAYPLSKPVGIRVQARGFRDSVIPTPKFPLSVRLKRGCPVLFEFAEALPKLQNLSDDTWQLSVVPKPVRGSLPHPTLDLARPLMSDRLFLPYPVQAGATSFRLPGLSPGRFSVHLEARQTRKGVNQRFLDLGEFVIPEDAKQLVKPLRFTKAELTKVFGS